MTLPPLSLRGKLFAFAALLILVPGVLLGFLSERSARESLQTVIGRELAREALHSADGLSVFLRAELATLESFAHQDLMREIRVSDIDKRISQALITLRDGSPARLDYIVVDNDRHVVAASSPQWLAGAGAGAQDLLPSDPPAYRGPLTLGRRRVLALATPIADPDGDPQKLGVLVGLLDWASITERLDEVRLSLAAQQISATLLLVDSDGERIATSGDAKLIATRSEADTENGYEMDPANQVIAGSAQLDADVPAWRLLIVEPLAHAFAPARELARHLAAMTTLALAAALILAALAAGRVVQPLSELTAAIRSMATGRLSATTVPVRSDDEVGELARSFNQMAADLDDAQKHLVEAEKFAFVGELAAGVAHEVRTSLGVLRSSAQMLGHSLESGPGPDFPELVGMIRDEVGRLGGVVDDLLTLDRPRALHPESTPLSRPLLSAAEFVEPQAKEKGVEIRITRYDVDPIVSCDREALQHACVNLLVNAVQALGEGGHVTISILAPAGDHACFRIEDDGPGVPDELRERIFEPFVTARSSGVGLGLTFVKRAIHEHGGRIRLVAGEADGACFEIRLPIETEDQT